MTNKLRFLKMMPILVILIFLSGCGHRERSMLNKVSLKMNKEQVKKELGEPDEILCPIINEKNERIDYWIYSLGTLNLAQYHKLMDSVWGFVFVYPLYPVGVIMRAFMESDHVYHDYYLKFVNDLLTKWDMRKNLLINKK